MTEPAPSQGERTMSEEVEMWIVVRNGISTGFVYTYRQSAVDQCRPGWQVVQVFPKSALDAAEERIKQLELSLAFESVDPERFENSWIAMDEKQRLEAMTTHRNRLAEILERTEQQLAAERVRADAAEAENKSTADELRRLREENALAKAAIYVAEVSVETQQMMDSLKAAGMSHAEASLGIGFRRQCQKAHAALMEYRRLKAAQTERAESDK